MREIMFSKLSGAGNDFIVVDNRKNVIKNPKVFALGVCDRKMSVGADGVLLLERSKKADLRMRIINSDGSEAEMCGNGVRCFGFYAFKNKIAKKHMSVETLSGIKFVEIIDAKKGYVKVNMGEPVDVKPGLSIRTDGRNFLGHFANTGVPHVIILDRKIVVRKHGKLIRNHKVFAPKGTNVNFVEVLGKNKIKVRTYERGVEDETFACGTGSTASAYVTSSLQMTKYPVKVITSGGEKLTIDTDSSGNLYMAGSVKYICDGRLASC